MFQSNLKVKEQPPIRDYLSSDDLSNRADLRRFKNKGLAVVEERKTKRGETILKLAPTTYFSNTIETNKKLNKILGIRYEHSNRGLNGKNKK